MIDSLILIITLLALVASANLFCNALEHLGENLKISEGVTGSIFAAVGTALPETIIPILSIVNSSGNDTNAAIGIGAILGAPLMLATLSLAIIALFVIPQSGINGIIQPEMGGLKRDLHFFFIGYALALIAIFSHKWLIANIFIAIILGLVYFSYVLLTIKDSAKLVAQGNQTKAQATLFLQRLGFGNSWSSIILQLIMSLAVLIIFAHLFIQQVTLIANYYQLPAFLLSLIIIPIATELPEKVNSIFWLRQKKDTLAIGNLTGAMVFQGTLLPIIGILFTNWSLSSALPAISIVITLLASLWLYYNCRQHNLRVWHFLLNGVFYLANITLCVYFR